jgi:hypothetical protein
MNEIFFQAAVLMGVWSNVTLGLIALYDRRKRKSVHRTNASGSPFSGSL